MYNEIQLLNKLQNAYGASTQRNNKFATAINAVTWDDTFQADGETYFIKGGLTLTIQNIDPFRQLWKPSFMVGDYHGEF